MWGEHSHQVQHTGSIIACSQLKMLYPLFVASCRFVNLLASQMVMIDSDSWYCLHKTKQACC